MSAATLKSILARWMPALLPIALVAVAVHAAWVPLPSEALVSALPWLVFAGALALSVRFNRSRAALALAVIGLAHFGLEASASTSDPARLRVLWQAAALLVPLNLGVIALLRERGFLTPHGIARIGAVAVQPVLVAWVAQPEHAAIAAHLDTIVVAWEPLATIALPQLAILATLLAAVVLVVGVVRFDGPIESGLLGAGVATTLALLGGVGDTPTALYFTTAGVILALGVVETSWSMAYRDELTGLPGRRALNEDMLKLGGRYAIAMLDVDHFKKFNDKYGHDVGDDVLRLVASRLARVRGGGKAYRYGGEEFTVVFPGRASEEVVPFLEELRAAVERAELTLRAKDRPTKKPKKKPARAPSRTRVSVTISIGAAQRGPSMTDPSAVIVAADKALYKAKKAGRNRVVA